MHMKLRQVAAALLLLGVGLGSIPATAGAPGEPKVFYFQRTIGDLHIEYAMLTATPPPPPSEATYVLSGARIPGGRGVFNYNPSGQPSWADPTFIPAAVAMWNGITPNLALTSSSTTTALAGLCSGGGSDGLSTITWEPTSGSVLGMACWWTGTGECDIILGSNYPTVDMRTVLAHELGHCLGLGHPADHPEALMYWQYHGPMTTPAKDDIEGVCALYGCSVALPTPTPPPAPTPRPTGCLRYAGLPFCLVIPFVAVDAR